MMSTYSARRPVETATDRALTRLGSFLGWSIVIAVILGVLHFVGLLP